VPCSRPCYTLSPYAVDKSLPFLLMGNSRVVQHLNVKFLAFDFEPGSVWFPSFLRMISNLDSKPCQNYKSSIPLSWSLPVRAEKVPHRVGLNQKSKLCLSMTFSHYILLISSQQLCCLQAVRGSDNPATYIITSNEVSCL
jgi:hypothetical protein